MTAEYTLTLHGHCGMPIPIAQGDKEDVRQIAAEELRRLRADGFPVTVLEKGKEWEVEEPEDCCMVPDECGILHIAAVPSRHGKCFECGSEDDWHEDGRGNVLCGCQACPDCGMVDAYGFHNAGCPQVREEWENEEEDCCEEEETA